MNIEWLHGVQLFIISKQVQCKSSIRSFHATREEEDTANEIHFYVSFKIRVLLSIPWKKCLEIGKRKFPIFWGITVEY